MERESVASMPIVEQSRRGLVIMAGAGVSAAAPTRLPGWYALNREIVTALCARVSPELSRNKRQAIEGLRHWLDERRQHKCFPPDYQAQLLEELCGERYFEAIQALGAVTQPNEIHNRIAWLAKQGVVRAVVTTNFDKLLERALDAHGVSYVAGYEANGYERQSLDLDASRERLDAQTPLPVLKVHGCLDDTSSLVDTLKQRLQGRNARLDVCLDHLLARHHVLVLGFSAEDLEGDRNYLRFVPNAERSPGLTYVQWPGAKELSRGAEVLLGAYANKHRSPVAECHDFLRDLGAALGLVPYTPAASTSDGTNSTELVAAGLKAWADGLSSSAAINCLAALAEANGASELAFALVHAFWDDPRDRDSVDFTALRALHGRLGMASGLLSLTADDNQSSKHEESLQNLLRVAKMYGDSRGYAWAALAFMWAGQRGRALALLAEADPGEMLAQEASADIAHTCAELFFLASEPEVGGKLWASAAKAARQASDLPRAARACALGALYQVEFHGQELDTFLSLSPVAEILDQAKRLSDPVTRGFIHLARGRQTNKQRLGEPALSELEQAIEAFGAAARPGWQLFARIEAVKACIDARQSSAARTLLERIDTQIDRHQVWLPWYQDAVGQWLFCTGETAEAVKAMELATHYARQMDNQRLEQALAQSLARYRETLEAIGARSCP